MRQNIEGEPYEKDWEKAGAKHQANNKQNW
jgi:hypothetical protein